VGRRPRSGAPPSAFFRIFFFVVDEKDFETAMGS